jgi:universal stress protein A
VSHTIDRIVIGIDFSETSEHALRYALELASQLGACVDLVHAYSLPAFALPIEGAIMASASQAADLSSRLGEQLTALVESHANSGVRMAGHLRVGAPDDELLAYAEQAGGKLIVVGTHGRTGAAHLLMGSVAERVVRRSPVPVLTVGKRD